MKSICFLVCCFSLIFFFTDCKKDDNENNSGSPGMLGEVGNTWNVKVNGTHDLSTQIIAKEGHVVTLEVSYAKMTVKTLKFGLIGNEVVDYVYSQGNTSKPFTMVKFDAEVGDSYSTTINGITHQREVIEKATYNVPALNKDLEMIGVYEMVPYEIPSTFFGFTVRDIYWYWHPDYGLVCVEFYTDQGDFVKVVFVDIEV
jgi:hypothetical protein